MTSRLSFTHAAVALTIAAFLLLFLVIPVVTVIYVAFTDSDGGLTLSHFGSFFGLTLMRESFYNSLYVGGMSVLIASIISLPLAYFTMRFRFRGAVLIQTLGVLPLIMPPFVGAAAMQLLFGRSGSVNLLLNEARDLAYSPVVSEEKSKDKEFLALYRNTKRSAEVTKQTTGLEEYWSNTARRNYARAAELANQAAALAK